jgi:hypothetical protein
VDRSWEYINRSQTHESGNWDRGRAILREGIHKWDFCCSVTHREGKQIEDGTTQPWTAVFSAWSERVSFLTYVYDDTVVKTTKFPLVAGLQTHKILLCAED